MEGKVSFHTRYETRTRVLDQDGNPVSEGVVAAGEGVAPPHPDVEGRNPETLRGSVDEQVNLEKPATQSEVQADVGKEESIGKGSSGKPRPASEGNEATK